MKALFLDRDGTLIVDKHHLADPRDVELIPGARDGLVRARELGYQLFILSNQSGIGRGYFTMADAQRCHDRMIELLDLGPDLFTGICMAPEAPDQPSRYRKPSPAFILEAIPRHGLDPGQCIMIGDRESDIRTGLNAGIRTAAVCTGKLDAAGWATLALPGVPVFPDFVSFSRSLE
jgi:D-glycero-D-manno-heptose 1,7-bisphosphate phosphatase